MELESLEYRLINACNYFRSDEVDASNFLPLVDIIVLSFFFFYLRHYRFLMQKFHRRNYDEFIEYSAIQFLNILILTQHQIPLEELQRSVRYCERHF